MIQGYCQKKAFLQFHKESLPLRVLPLLERNKGQYVIGGRGTELDILVQMSGGENQAADHKGYFSLAEMRMFAFRECEAILIASDSSITELRHKEYLFQLQKEFSYIPFVYLRKQRLAEFHFDFPNLLVELSEQWKLLRTTAM